MSAIKNSLISLYCHFNKMIKGPGTSFQSPALGQKHVRNLCPTVHQYLTKFNFDSTQDSKEKHTKVKHKCYFHYVAIPMITSQSLKSVDFPKTQKSRYLENETFFHQIKKKTFIAHQGLLYDKKQFSSGCNLSLINMFKYL